MKPVAWYTVWQMENPLGTIPDTPVQVLENRGCEVFMDQAMQELRNYVYSQHVKLLVWPETCFPQVVQQWCDDCSVHSMFVVYVYDSSLFVVLYHVLDRGYGFTDAVVLDKALLELGQLYLSAESFS